MEGRRAEDDDGLADMKVVGEKRGVYYNASESWITAEREGGQAVTQAVKRCARCGQQGSSSSPSVKRLGGQLSIITHAPGIRPISLSGSPVQVSPRRNISSLSSDFLPG